MTNDIVIIHSNSMYWVKLPTKTTKVRELNLSLVTYVEASEDFSTILVHLMGKDSPIVLTNADASYVLNEIENYRNQLTTKE